MKPEVKINYGTPSSPNWVKSDADDSETVGGKYPADFLTKLSGETLPTAGVAYRGQFFLLEGDAGNADILYCCIKNSDDNYEWGEVTLS